MSNTNPVSPSPEQLEWINTHWDIDTSTGLVKSIAKNKILGTVNNHGYIVVTIPPRKQIQVANLIWWKAEGYWPPIQLDHDDKNKTNNRRSNLLLASHSRQMHNRDIQPGKHGYGVHETNDSVTPAFETRIRIEGKLNVVRHSTATQAEAMYLEEKRKLLGRQIT